MQIPEPLYPRNGKRTKRTKKNNRKRKEKRETGSSGWDRGGREERRRENLSGQAHSGTDLQGCRCFTTPQSAARRPLPIAPRPHQRSVVKDRPRLDSTRLESIRRRFRKTRLVSVPRETHLVRSPISRSRRGSRRGRRAHAR